MRAKPRHFFLVLVIAIIVGGLVATVLCLKPRTSEAGVFTTLDPAYKFRFVRITQGTNHTIFSGNSEIAWLKWKLYQTPLRSVVHFFPRSLRAEIYSRNIPTNTTVLWVGWTHKDYSVTVTNGIPYVANPMMGDLVCVLSEPNGHTTPLNFFVSAQAPFIKELMIAWEMPASVTNFTDCTVHLQERRWQKNVATIRLQ